MKRFPHTNLYCLITFKTDFTVKYPEVLGNQTVVSFSLGEGTNSIEVCSCSILPSTVNFHPQGNGQYI